MSALGGVALHRQPDGLVEHAVDDAERPALQPEAMPVGEVVDAAAQDVVLGHDLFDVKPILNPLLTVSGGRALPHGLGNRLFLLGVEGGRQFLDQLGNVVVEGGVSRFRAEGICRTCSRQVVSRQFAVLCGSASRACSCRRLALHLHPTPGRPSDR
jgi:hypothetical protein